MTAASLVAARQAVEALAAALGVPAAAVAAAEEVDRLVLRDDRWPRDRLDALDPAQIRALVAAAPVVATLAQGDVDQLPLDAPDGAWATLRDVSRGNPWLTLTIAVDKAALGAGPQARVVLYPGTLARLWRRGPAALEAAIRDALPVTIGVAAPGLALRGQGFAIGEATPTREPDADGWMARARPFVRWADRWAERLSPLDLHLTGDDPDDVLASVARATAVEAALRSLADAVTLDGPIAVALFVSRGVRVELPARFDGRIDADAADALVRLTAWAFTQPFAQERSGVVRAVLADALGPLEPADRGPRLLADAVRLEAIAHDRFQGFVEQRLDLWAGEVRRLDEEVVRAIAGYTDEISAMVKDLSDTALASVGVLVASIVTTSRTEHGAVLPVMLLAYAAYILAFPWWLRLGWHRERYGLVGDRLELALERFRAVIGRARVDGLVGARVVRVQAAFARWDRIAVAAYLGLAVAAGVGAATSFLLR